MCCAFWGIGARGPSSWAPILSHQKLINAAESPFFLLQMNSFNTFDLTAIDTSFLGTFGNEDAMAPSPLLFSPMTPLERYMPESPMLETSPLQYFENGYETLKLPNFSLAFAEGDRKDYLSPLSMMSENMQEPQSYDNQQPLSAFPSEAAYPSLLDFEFFPTNAGQEPASAYDEPSFIRPSLLAPRKRSKSVQLNKAPHHVRSLSDVSRIFKCQLCTSSFSRNHDLKRHERIHTGLKPFACSTCSKHFTRMDALQRHATVRGCKALKM